MDSKTLVSMANSCTKSRAYFRALKYRGRRYCPWCNHSRKIYRLSDGKFKCSMCRKKFTDFSGTYLSGIRIQSGQLAYLMHMFVMGVPAFRLVKTTGLDDTTIERLFKRFRQAIYDRSLITLKQLSGKLELDETMFGGRRPGKRGWGAEGKVIVFGIYKRNGEVVVFPVSNRKKETLDPLIDRHTRTGSVYYTDEYEGYVGLVVRGRHIRVTKDKGKPVRRANINGIEGYWSYAKHWLYHYRGVPRKYFHLYLKEIEFRFNNRNKDLFDELANILVGGKVGPRK